MLERYSTLIDIDTLAKELEINNIEINIRRNSAEVSSVEDEIATIEKNQSANSTHEEAKLKTLRLKQKTLKDNVELAQKSLPPLKLEHKALQIKLEQTRSEFFKKCMNDKNVATKQKMQAEDVYIQSQENIQKYQKESQQLKKDVEDVKPSPPIFKITVKEPAPQKFLDVPSTASMDFNEVQEIESRRISPRQYYIQSSPVGPHKLAVMAVEQPVSKKTKPAVIPPLQSVLKPNALPEIKKSNFNNYANKFQPAVKPQQKEVHLSPYEQQQKFINSLCNGRR